MRQWLAEKYDRHKSEVAVGLFVNLVWAVPAILAALYLLIKPKNISDHPQIFLIGAATIWGVSVLLLFWQWRQQRKAYRQRMISLATALYSADMFYLAWFGTKKDKQKTARKTCQEAVAGLLATVCEVTGPSVPERETGASFLLLESADEDAHFIWFASIRHGHSSHRKEVERLSRLDSLAGKALTRENLVAIKDCRNASWDCGWKGDYHEKGAQGDAARVEYLGRACAPVFSYVDGNYQELGSLCVDFAQPYLVSEEDQAIIKIVASKVGQICTNFDIRLG